MWGKLEKDFGFWTLSSFTETPGVIKTCLRMHAENISAKWLLKTGLTQGMNSKQVDKIL